MRSVVVTFAAILAAASLAACDRASHEPVTGGAPPVRGAASAPPPTSGATDPSLPPAGPAVGKQSGTAQQGTDSKANPPNTDLTKKEESTAMPKANQANNHSSPNAGTSTKP